MSIVLRCVNCGNSFLGRYRNRYSCPECVLKMREACMALGKKDDEESPEDSPEMPLDDAAPTVVHKERVVNEMLRRWAR